MHDKRLVYGCRWNRGIQSGAKRNLFFAIKFSVVIAARVYLYKAPRKHQQKATPPTIANPSVSESLAETSSLASLGSLLGSPLPRCGH